MGSTLHSIYDIAGSAYLLVMPAGCQAAKPLLLTPFSCGD
jgi:hypothetical protein